MPGRESPFVVFASLGVVIVALIGIAREGFSSAQGASGLNDSQFANTTAGQLEAATGGIVELLPLLMMALAAVILLKSVR